MLLCFDIGNTNVVLAIVENKEIKRTFRFVTNDHLTADEYYQKVKSVIGNQIVEGVVISNVVPALDTIFDQMVKKYFNLTPMFIAPGIKSGLKLKIDSPKTLGADLLCDAVGAIQKYQTPLIIVDLGTATKFIVVNDKKEYLGGAIAPGMNGSLNSLISSAAKLSHTALVKPKNIIGNDTTTCIQSGMIYGTVAMIEGMISKIKAELNVEEINVILTGGLSELIKDIIEIPFHYEPNILIIGLIHLYYKNQQD